MKKRTIIMSSIIALLVVVALSYKPLMAHLDERNKSATVEEAEKPNPLGPAFNADSAYTFVKMQCDFGPRTMNSTAHDRCAAWIISQFKQYGCETEVQKATLKGYDGTALQSQNIIARFNPTAPVRVLLCAHWDARPWADNDPDSINWRKPILAANDGASGVAVMMEIARLISTDKQLKIGVDFICFDAEDWGTPRWANVEDNEDSWALGAQYFARNFRLNPRPRFGILLDMVGGQGAKFYQEAMSAQYAPEVLQKVWQAARQAGFGSYFPMSKGGMITDDHVPLNKIANIPTIDIIPYYPDCVQSSFGPTWHTVSDDLAHIDPQTLKAVGQTIIQVLYQLPMED